MGFNGVFLGFDRGFTFFEAWETPFVAPIKGSAFNREYSWE